MTTRSFAAVCASLFSAAAIAAEPTSASAKVAPETSPAAAETNAGTAEPAPVKSSAGPKITYSECHVEGPYIAMTFDDGPHAQNTPRLLDMLKQRNIKATFFVVGECAQEYPQIMKRIVAEGHEIGNHSWSHPLLSKMGEGAVTDQLQKTHDAIVNATGIAPKIMRPPYGGFTANQRAWANGKWGYKIILWDVDPLDWKVRNSERVKTAILHGTVNGSIVLSHDIHKTTVDAMPDTLDGLIGRGFKFVTVSELLAMDKPLPPQPKATPAPKATPTPKAPESGSPENAEPSSSAPTAPAPARKVSAAKLPK